MMNSVLNQLVLLVAFLSQASSWAFILNKNGLLQQLRPPKAVGIIRHKSLISPGAPMRAVGLSQRFAFPWFGGTDEEAKDVSDEIAPASLVGVANIMDSMANFKNSQRVGDRTSAVLQDLSNILVEGTSADGKVKVTYDGQQKPMGVQIDETYFKSLKDRKEGLNELGVGLTQAMQDAHSKSAAKVDEKMKSLYSDLGF